MRRPGWPGVTGTPHLSGGRLRKAQRSPAVPRCSPPNLGRRARGACPPAPALRLPGTQRAAKDTAGMLLLHGGLLGVDGFADADGLRGHRAQRSEAHQAAFPGNTAPAGRRATQTGPVLAGRGRKRGQAFSRATRTPPLKTPGAFGGWGTRTKACAGGSPPPVCDLRALGSPRKARPPGPGERSGRVPVACSGLVRLWEKLPDLGPHDTPRTTQAAPTLLRRGPGR